MFILPTPLHGQPGPVAGWLNTAGWTAAASRLGFGVTVLTSFGVIESDSLRDRALSLKASLTTARRVSSTLPVPLKVALKDVRDFVRARRFARLVGRTGPQGRPSFVWQRHELFQRAGRRLADQMGCPLVLYVPAPKVWEARAWGVRRPGWEAIVERFGDVTPLQEADLVACVSHEVAEAVGLLGIDPKRIIVTPSTVDTELFRPDLDISDIRRRYSLEGRFVVGWAGSFRSFHGLDVLLDAIETASSQIPHLVGLLVGDGPDRERLEKDV
ncbi:MAG TPA: glycosyltransferase, partial [Acidimicrobiia bacterium]|nr:glycosyltransferase [Acidimicrobiia bacterium]